MALADGWNHRRLFGSTTGVNAVGASTDAVGVFRRPSSSRSLIRAVRFWVDSCQLSSDLAVRSRIPSVGRSSKIRSAKEARKGAAAEAFRRHVMTIVLDVIKVDGSILKKHFPPLQWASAASIRHTN